MLTLAHPSQFCLSPVEAGVPGGREQCDLLLSPPHGERSRAGLAEGLVRRPRQRAAGALHLRGPAGTTGKSRVAFTSLVKETFL